MGKVTKIEWATSTFNPWWGCHKVSQECTRCYAETFAKRVGQKIWGTASPRRFFGTSHWQEPLRWNAEAARRGEPCRVFCASMADVFEDRDDLTWDRGRLWELIEETPALTWMLLTKRPENMRAMTPRAWAGEWPRNVWAATTVGHSDSLPRAAQLLLVPAAIRFLSVEPLLERLELSMVLPGMGIDPKPRGGAVGPPRVDWVLCGGESGHGARAMHPTWVRSLRDQCTSAGVAFLFKQWGDWLPQSQMDATGVKPAGRMARIGDELVYRVGKKAAGRLLDGRTWDEVPVLPPLTAEPMDAR